MKLQFTNDCETVSIESIIQSLKIPSGRASDVIREDLFQDTVHLFYTFFKPGNIMVDYNTLISLTGSFSIEFVLQGIGFVLPKYGPVLRRFGEE